MLFIVMFLIMICMALVVVQIEAEVEVVETSISKTRRVRIARDRVGVVARNNTCLRGHLPHMTATFGPNRSYRRAHNIKLHEEATLRLREKAEREERLSKISIKKRSKLNRWIKNMVWNNTRNTRRKHVVSSPLWCSHIAVPIHINLGSYTLAVKNTKKNTRKEKRQWDILQSRMFMAIARGDTSPTTKALYEAAREMVRAA